jgi:hypothetical protein
LFWRAYPLTALAIRLGDGRLGYIWELGGSTRMNDLEKSGDRENENQKEDPVASQAANNPKNREYEKTIALWTTILGASTVALVFATAINAFFLWVTDHTLKDTLRANRLSQRPWLSIEVNIAGPFTYNLTDGAKIPLEINIQNTGNEPALDILPAIGMYGERIGRVANIQEIIALFMTECENVSKIPIKGTFGMGEVLMPKQTRKFSFVASMSAEEVRIGISPFGKRSFMPPVISGCFSYSYNDGEGGRHRTTFSYSPMRKDNRVFYIDEGETAPDLLKLEPWIGRLFHAN